MKVLIVADPLTSLKPAGDTGLALLHELVSRGHAGFWCTPSDIYLELSGKPRAIAAVIGSTVAGELPKCNGQQQVCLADLDVILIRKDPPFDSGYASMCWILSALENKVVVSNRASLLLQLHEKSVPLLAVAAGAIGEDEWLPPSVFFSASSFEQWHDQLTADHRWILKPWRGYAGNSVTRVESTKELKEAFCGLPDLSQGWIIQPYRSKVEETGDRRVFVLNGKIMGSFVRRAQAGDFVTNMAQGGYVEFYDMPAHELALCERVADFLVGRGIDFAGLDIIDSRLNEVNLTAPTGVRVLKEHTGVDIPKAYVDLLEQRVKSA